MDALVKFDHSSQTKQANKNNKRNLVSAPILRVAHKSIAKVLYGQALPICHTEISYKNYNFQIEGTSRYFGV